MGAWCRWICLLLLVTGPRLPGATGAEDRAFNAAVKELRDGLCLQAEADFADFARKYPASTNLPEAILYQAQARVKLTNYAGALELLAGQQAQAGPLADQYLFSQADAYFQKGDFAAAATNFARLIDQFPASTRRLDSAVWQAAARARLGEWNQVADLLQRTNGVFQLAAPVSLTNELVSRGLLLLAEARFRQGAWSAAEAALQPLTNAPLAPALDWQRHHLRCRIYVATQRPEAALQDSTNLLTLATAAAEPALQAQSAALQGSILETLGRRTEAIAAYQINLATRCPAESQRQALVKITELALAETKLPEATALFEKFLSQSPASPCADLALLTIAEFKLRQVYASAAETNLLAVRPAAGPLNTNLQPALTRLTEFTNRFPNSSLLGKAQFDLGWCFWLGGRLPESESAFQLAAQRLPVGIDQAMALFKLADCQFEQTNFAAAMNNYSVLRDKYTSVPEVQTNLLEAALYQLVRASLAAAAIPAATNALAQMVALFPNGSYTERAVLFAGQEVGRRDPALARKLLALAAPNARLLPEVQLAKARTYEQENNPAAAITEYTNWLATFTNHPAQPRAMYCLARANAQAGSDTNAFIQFTNFIAAFPTNDFALLAQLWVADYYFQSGDYVNAERNYQWCYQNTNFPASDLAYQARMMAGRAAVARQSWEDAKEYFRWLANSSNCPPDLRAQAFYAYGDYWMSRDSTNKFADYQEAFKAFDEVNWRCPSNQMTVLAWGAKANCLLQMARTTHDYQPVTNAYQQVIDSPLAEVAARAAAKVGLGWALERMAEDKPQAEQFQLWNLALRQYTDVLYDNKFLRDGEKPDLFWTQRAGHEAARLLADSLKQPTQAINLLRRLQEQFPSTRLEDKINSLKAQEQQSRFRG